MSSDEKTVKKKTSSKRKSKTDELQSQVELMEAELAESKDKFIRLYAEFDNYKKRTVRERLDLIKTAGSEMIADLLPVLDDFDRAKKSAEDENSNEVFSEGVTLVYNKIYGILKNKGLEAMETNGEDFDPELHEAITEIPAPADNLKGKILDTIEKGYTLNSKIIRHAKVIVGK
jgi:molecular chaperone GrpE